MARPIKNTVDYFPHIIQNGKTIFILESKFGNDGYAFWFKLLELLGTSHNHVYDYNNSVDWEFLLAKTKVSEEKATEILKTLAEVGAIDKDLWGQKTIWCENFVKGIEDVYKKRRNELPKKPSLRSGNPSTPVVSDSENTQTKLKETKVKESIKKERQVSDDENTEKPKKEVDPLEFSFTDKCGYELDDWRIKMYSGRYPKLSINFLLEDVYRRKFLSDPNRYQKEIAIAGGVEKLVWMWLGQDEKYRKIKEAKLNMPETAKGGTNV